MLVLICCHCVIFHMVHIFYNAVMSVCNFFYMVHIFYNAVSAYDIVCILLLYTLHLVFDVEKKLLTHLLLGTCATWYTITSFYITEYCTFCISPKLLYLIQFSRLRKFHIVPENARWPQYNIIFFII